MIVVASVVLAALYAVPSPLPQAKPGAVISSQPFTGGSALSDAARNVFVLYHTVSPTGRDVAVSGVISVPKGTPAAGGWPVISWAHGTTGNAPQCAPSQFKSPDIEQQMLNRFVAAGYAVAQTDYEGEGTPGLHPYFVGVAGAHDVTDIVRAARELDPQIGDRWIVMGHSEGGTVTLFTASLAPSWAPDLHLLGAVAYAPASDITDVLGMILVRRQPMMTLPLSMMMVEGIASADPSIDLTRILSPQGLALLPQLQQSCIGTLFNSPAWNSVSPASLFQPHAPVDRLVQDFQQNEPINVSIRVPLLLAQGTDDQMVSPLGTDALRSTYCSNRARVELASVAGAAHDTIMSRSFDLVKDWVAQRFAGARALSNCS